MKKIIHVSILLFVLFLTSCKDDDVSTTTTNVEDFTNEIEDQEIAEIIKENVANFPNNTQVSIAIINNEQTEYIGIKKQDDVFQINDNKNKIFEIGSISKVMTNVLLSSLINKQQALLNETLQDQFDFSLNEGGDIMLLNLANHSSGLPRIPTNYDTADFDPEDPYAHYTPELLESYLENDVVLNSTTGSQIEYSNLGTGLLGYILAKKTDKTYEELLQETILEPLQMNNSTTLLSKVDLSQLVDGLNEDGNITSNWNFTDASVGAGGIKSSVADLEKFTRKNFEDDVVYNLPQSTTYSDGDGGEIGLGWFITEDEGFRVLFHDGGTGGYTSMLALDKNNKKAVIVLSNVSAFNTSSSRIGQLCFSLLENISID